MKLLTFILCLISGLAYSQTDSVYIKKAALDSLAKRIDRLERNQTIVVSNIRESGKAIKTGALLVGLGTMFGITGAIVASLSKPVTITDNRGRTYTRPSTTQYVGFGFSGIGFAMSIAGVFKIGEGGRTMKDL